MASQPVPVPPPEPPAPERMPSVQPGRAAHLEDDGEIVRRTVRVALIAIPLFVAFWVGLVALAISFTTVGYGPALAMAAGVGVLAGLFWASWYGFVAFSHHEEAERRATRWQ
jgi:hypothetical protein